LRTLETVPTETFANFATSRRLTLMVEDFAPEIEQCQIFLF
jgi:glycyl-tRNA synthetase beta subunit